MKGGAREGAGRPKQDATEKLVKQVQELLGECTEDERLRRLERLRQVLGELHGRYEGARVVETVLSIAQVEDAAGGLPVKRGKPAKRQPPQTRFGHVEREDVVKEVPWEPGDSGGA